jgi:hypothetical protein
MNNGLIEVAVSPHYQWNGVAVSPHGRLFASFPRWLNDETISVGEILTNGTIRPFPGGDWNTWHPKQSSEHPGHRFISVNAIYTDRANNYGLLIRLHPPSVQSCLMGQSSCRLI